MKTLRAKLEPLSDRELRAKMIDVNLSKQERQMAYGILIQRGARIYQRIRKSS